MSEPKGSTKTLHSKVYNDNHMERLQSYKQQSYETYHMILGVKRNCASCKTKISTARLANLHNTINHAPAALGGGEEAAPAVEVPQVKSNKSYHTIPKVIQKYISCIYIVFVFLLIRVIVLCDCYSPARCCSLLCFNVQVCRGEGRVALVLDNAGKAAIHRPMVN